MVRQWVKRQDPNFELGPWQPNGSFLDHLDEQRFRDIQHTVMQNAASNDPAPMRLLRGFHIMMGNTWGPEQEAQARSSRGIVSQISSFLMRWAPDLWDKMHGSRGSVASLASAIAKARRRDPSMTAEMATQQAEELAEQLYANPMIHRGFSMRDMGLAYGEAAKRGIVGRFGDTQSMVKDLTPVIGALSAVRDTMGGKGYDVSDVRGLFAALDNVAPSAGYNYREAERAIRVGNQLSRRGGMMGDAMARAGQSIRGTGTSLEEFNQLNKKLTADAGGSNSFHMLAGAARAEVAGMLKPDSRASQILESAVADYDLTGFDPRTWREIMLESAVNPHDIGTPQHDRSENNQFVRNNPKYRNLALAVRANQQQIDHGDRLAQIEQRFANSPNKQMHIEGALSRFARQRGYKNRQQYAGLHGDNAKQLNAVMDNAENKARIAQNASHLGWAGPVARTADALKKDNPTPTSVGAAFLGVIDDPQLSKPAAPTTPKPAAPVTPLKPLNPLDARYA